MKKSNALLLILSVLCMIGSILLIPLNLFGINLPEYITIIAAVLTFIFILAYCIKKPGKTALKIILPLLGLLTITITLFGAYANPYWNSDNMKKNRISASVSFDEVISYDKAEADLAFMMKYLKKNHPVFYRSTPPDTVQEAYDNALKELKQNENAITVNLLTQKAEGILSVLKDAHTSVQGNYAKPRYLKTVAPRKAENWELIKINGTPIETLFENNQSLFSYEVETWGITRLRNQLLTLEGLAYLGFDIHTPISYTYKDDAGNEETEINTAESFVTYEEYIALNENYFKDKADESFVSYTVDEEKSLAILTLTSCQYNDEYRTCVNNMFSEIKNKNIQNIAVDLRENGGGNSLVMDYFLSYLDIDSYKVPTSKWRFGPIFISTGDGTAKNEKKTDLLFNGNLYLFTSTGSFSSAMIFAQCVKDNAIGTIIGEAPGNTPNGYGDIAVFTLPNSKLYFQVSTKQFFRADSNAAGPLVEPDIHCGKDSVLETLYDVI